MPPSTSVILLTTKDKEKAEPWKQPERNDTLNTEKQKFNQILASYQKKTENQRADMCRRWSRNRHGSENKRKYNNLTESLKW